MGWTSDVARQVIVDGSASGDGVFVYNGTPASGNLIVSIAAEAGTDPYGNTYPQGLFVSAGIIEGGTFVGNDFIINSSGVFFYNGTPAAGNLVLSIAAAAGTDQFGNAYLADLEILGPNGSFINLADNGTVAALIFNPQSVTHQTDNPQIISAAVNAGAVNELDSLIMGSGKNGGSDAALQLFAESADSTIAATAVIEFGGSVSCFISLASGIVACQPGTTDTPETWHNMSLSSGWTLNTGGFAQYKLMPDNTVAIRFGGLKPGTFTDGTELWAIPAGYVPGFIGTQSFPIAVSYSTAPAFGSTAEVVFKNSGQMQCFNLRGTITSIAGSMRYPLD